MADSLDELEQEAAERSRRTGRRGRNPGQPRHPRKTGTEDEAAKRRQELEERQRERERRREREADKTDPPPPPPPAPESEPEAASPPEPDTSGEGSEGRSGGKRAKRPKSMPFYPNPEHEAFLWRVIEAGSARQMRIPATAVLRLALTRLEEQMTPSEIVKAVGDSVQPDGKMGRPRL